MNSLSKWNPFSSGLVSGCEAGSPGEFSKEWAIEIFGEGPVIRLRKKNGLRSGDRRPFGIRDPCRLPAEGIEGFFHGLADAGENRRIAQGIPRSFGFTQRHHEVEEVFRLIAFEGYDPFLVIETE